MSMRATETQVDEFLLGLLLKERILSLKSYYSLKRETYFMVSDLPWGYIQTP